MNTTTLGVVGAAALAISGSFTYLVSPTPKFMTVHDMYYSDGQVFADRSIHVDGKVVADWSVVVVHEDSDQPTCQTRAGPNLHEGWSVYRESERQKKAFTLDLWVGDPGCFERLQPGHHTMFVVWRPRNGGEPVSDQAEFDFP